MGGDRQQKIEEMFSNPAMAENFEPPVFSPGVSSRYIRNRVRFLEVANDAGLLPPLEWKAVYEADRQKTYEGQPTERFFDCLESIPVTKGRHGSREDKELHYSVELWRKSKAINRERSVLACVFAHLIAMKTFVGGGFDLILEDNVRVDPRCCAQRIRESLEASGEWERDRGEAATDDDDDSPSKKCHFRFFGWLGSVPNLEWILQTHTPKRKYVRNTGGNGRGHDGDEDDLPTMAPIPLLEHLEEDLPAIEEEDNSNSNTATENTDKESHHNSDTSDEAGAAGQQQQLQHQPPLKQHKKPGGNLIWGAYAYSISKEAYKQLMETLRSDVGAMVWKGKRMRNYAVKPIDKILPRQTVARFGPASVQIASHPAFFRAPMLTSKIHSKWDPGFCESTAYQLQQTTKLGWSGLWLTDTEREIVKHHDTFGKWLTVSELESLPREKTWY